MSTPIERVPDEAYLADEEAAYAEYVEGDAYRAPPPGTQHQDIVLFLGSLFRFVCESTGAGRVFVAPTMMKLGGTGRAPDVFVVRHDGRATVRATHVDGPADLVVEVVSPESAPRDRVEKLVEYQAQGVREYWLIDPQRRSAEVYQRDAGDRFQRVGTRLSGQVLPLVDIDPEWLWSEPMPSLREILDRWGVK